MLWGKTGASLKTCLSRMKIWPGPQKKNYFKKDFILNILRIPTPTKEEMYIFFVTIQVTSRWKKTGIYWLSEEKNEQANYMTKIPVAWIRISFFGEFIAAISSLLLPASAA